MTKILYACANRFELDATIARFLKDNTTEYGGYVYNPREQKATFAEISVYFRVFEKEDDLLMVAGSRFQMLVCGEGVADEVRRYLWSRMRPDL